jgi:hypothetical protein
MKYVLENTGDLTAEQLAAAIAKGGKFIVFRYQVSLLAVSFLRLSPAIFIRHADELNAYRKKYNLKAWLMGLWFFPTGPFSVARAIRFNNSGGLDVTVDILQNLEFFDREAKSVEIKTVDTVFGHLPKDELKELKSAVLDYCTDFNGIRELYAGRFVNVGEGTEPPYMIGADTDKECALLEKELKALIYTRFNDFVPFVFFTAKQDPQLYEKIVRQGQAIKKKGVS